MNLTTQQAPLAPGAARRLWPPESCGVQPIDQAIDRYRSLWDAMWSTTGELKELSERRRLADAQRQDEEEHGAAIIANKRTSFEPKNVEKLRQDIALLTRKRAAQVVAVNKAAKLLDEAMAEHRDTLDAATADELEAAEAQWVAAAEAIEAAGRRLADARRLRDFAAGTVEKRLGYGKPLHLANLGTVRDPDSVNVAAALRAVVAPAGPDPGPLHITGEVTGAALAGAA